MRVCAIYDAFIVPDISYPAIRTHPTQCFPFCRMFALSPAAVGTPKKQPKLGMTGERRRCKFVIQFCQVLFMTVTRRTIIRPVHSGKCITVQGSHQLVSFTRCVLETEMPPSITHALSWYTLGTVRSHPCSAVRGCFFFFLIRTPVSSGLVLGFCANHTREILENVVPSFRGGILRL